MLMGRHLFQVPPHRVAPQVQFAWNLCVVSQFFSSRFAYIWLWVFSIPPFFPPSVVWNHHHSRKGWWTTFPPAKANEARDCWSFFMRSIRYQEGGRASSASLMCKNPIWFCQSTCHRPPEHTLDDDPTCCCFFSRDHQHFFMQRCTCCSLQMSWGD